MKRDLLPEELVQSLLQQAVVLILQSHGYTAIQPRALNLLIETVEKRTLNLSSHFTYSSPLQKENNPRDCLTSTILTDRTPRTITQSILHGQHPTQNNPFPHRPPIRLPNGKHPHLHSRRRNLPLPQSTSSPSPN